jgi:hypothetical protein
LAQDVTNAAKRRCYRSTLHQLRCLKGLTWKTVSPSFHWCVCQFQLQTKDVFRPEIASHTNSAALMVKERLKNLVEKYLIFIEGNFLKKDFPQTPFKNFQTKRHLKYTKKSLKATFSAYRLKHGRHSLQMRH